MAASGKALLVMVVLFLAVFIFSTISFAAPIIEEVIINPSSEIWLGENVDVFVNCSDDANYVTGVYANLSGPTGNFSERSFTYQAGLYNFTFQTDRYFYTKGVYHLSLVCFSNSSESYSYPQIELNVHNLSGNITEITPLGPLYNNTFITAYFDLMKDGDSIMPPDASGPNFTIFIDDQQKSTGPINDYYSGKGFILPIGIQQSGSHLLKVKADYSRTSLIKTLPINVNNEINFYISSLSPTTLKSGDLLTLIFYASNGSQPIDMNSSNFDFFIGGHEIPDSGIKSFSYSSGSYTVKLIAPALATASYDILVKMMYNGQTYSSPVKTVYYMTSISGIIKDGADKSVYTQFDFYQNEVKNLSFSTDSGGSYSSTIQPGTYDINIKFPRATLYIKQASVNNFNDPVKYDYLEENSVSGLNSIAAFNFEFGNSFGNVNIEMNYNDKLVDDERSLRVFACYNWNSGKRSCNGNWSEVDFIQDTIRNTVSVYASSLSAFAIGKRQNLSIVLNTDKESYYVSENARLSGIVYGSGDSRVSGASVQVYAKGTNLKFNTTTGDGGEFIFNFPIDIPEGNYTFVVSVEKSPFGKANETKRVEILNKREILIKIPSAIRIARGSEASQEVEIINNGQIRLSNVSINLSGISSDWFSIEQYYYVIEPGEKIKATIFFRIPSDADASTSSATLLISSNELKEEKKIGFTILENQTDSELPVAAPSGSAINIGFPQIQQIGYEYITFAAIFVSAFAAMVFFKPKKNSREEIKNALGEVKNYLDIRMTHHIQREEQNRRSDREIVNG